MKFKSQAIALVSGLTCAAALSASVRADDLPRIAQRLGELFQSVTRQRPPVQRPVFAKAHGCVQARFEVSPDLPAGLKAGVFAEAKSFPAWIRFSNDGAPTPDAQPTARGMAVKLVGVPGKKLLDGEENAQTQDFIMQNHPIFFSDNAQDFLDFIESSLSRDPAVRTKFNQAHPETDRILAEMDKNVLADPLDGQYWTPTPYKLGSQAMKYMAKPCSPPPAPASKPMSDPNFLRKNMAAHLQQGDACFGFYVQLQKDAESMPLDRATVLWSEEKSPFVRVATITIPMGQNIDAPAREAACENLSFNGWHALPEHEPLGSINGVRRFVYKQLADYRRMKNHKAAGEPTAIDPNQ